jgi:hypothetical protein
VIRRQAIASQHFEKIQIYESDAFKSRSKEALVEARASGA